MYDYAEDAFEELEKRDREREMISEAIDKHPGGLMQITHDLDGLHIYSVPPIPTKPTRNPKKDKTNRKPKKDKSKQKSKKISADLIDLNGPLDHQRDIVIEPQSEVKPDPIPIQQ